MNKEDNTVKVKSPYSKINKDVIIEELEQLKQKEIIRDKKIKDYDAMKLRYDILKDARKEDKQAVENAGIVAHTFLQREQELITSFKLESHKMQENIMEQNQTILTLFEMMDNAINQQIFYYHKFKSIYVSMNSPQKEEEKPK